MSSSLDDAKTRSDARKGREGVLQQIAKISITIK